MKNKKLLVLLAATLSLGVAKMFPNKESVVPVDAVRYGPGDYGVGDGGGGSGSSIKNESEPNNDFAQANDLMSGSPSLSNFNKEFKGAMSDNDSKDYYAFMLLGNANVEIKLTGLASDCDYDIELFENSRIMHEKRDTEELILNENRYSTPKRIAGSYKNVGQDEKISINLKPNYYYIKVFSYSFGSHSSYKISVSANYIASQNSSITSLKNSGNKGAIWYSDYDPFGIKPNSRYKSLADTNDCFIDTSYGEMNFKSPLYQYLSGKGRIKSASLYVWDEDMIKVIRDMELINFTMYSAIKEAYENSYDRHTIEEKFESAKGSVENGLKVVGIGAGITTILSGGSISAGFATYEEICSLGGGFLGGLIIAEIALFYTVFQQLVDNCLLYEIDDLDHRISFSNSIIGRCDDVLNTANGNTVMQIDFFYRMNNNCGTRYEYKFDSGCNDAKLFNTNYTIYGNQSNAYMNGRIYPIKTYNDIDNVFNR